MAQTGPYQTNIGQTVQQTQPMWGSLLSMLPTVGPILGGIANQITSRIGINKQNQYNSPASQVDRLRKAGLPMASMTPAGAGNQSAVPQAHLGGGIAEGSKNIGLYAQTQQTKEAIKLLNEQIRIQKAEADLKEGERNYKLGQAGTDIAGTNLTETMKSEQLLKVAEGAGKEIENAINENIRANQGKRFGLENEQIAASTAKTLMDTGLVKEGITGQQLENDLKEIAKEWNPKLNSATHIKLLADKGLIDANTSGKNIENAIQTINKRILEETSGNIVDQSDIDLAMKKVMSADQWANFIQSTQYRDLVQKAREIFQDPIQSPEKMGENFAALIYTTLSEITGLAGRLLGGK